MKPIIAAERPRFIETLPKRGYRLIGSVEAPARAADHTPARRAKIAVLPFANLSGDPEFALGHNALGEVYWYMGFFGFVPPKETFSAGVWALLRAIEIDDKLAEAHTLLGVIRKELDYNWPDAHREMRRALELDPWSPFARFGYGMSGLMPLGRIAEAITELERALELDPLSAFMRFWLAILFDLDRQYERGMQETRLLVEHAPAYWPGRMAAGHLYRDMKMYDQATAAFRRASELAGGSPIMLGWLGQGLVLSGDTAEARDTMIIPIKTYPFLDPLRADPRFLALLRKMNLEP